MSTPHLCTPNGLCLPKLGQGTWAMGEDPMQRQQEIRALQTGFELGLNLVDTAEMYADGESERVVAQAIGGMRGQREETFLISKVHPKHASHADTLRACFQSLKRLGTDYLDLYLLHWRDESKQIPLSETIGALEQLVREGAIRGWGVSNFSPQDMEDLKNVPAGQNVQTNQVLYNLTRRGIEHDLLPQSQKDKLPIMAYSPIEQGRLLQDSALSVLSEVARPKQATPAQIALAWVLHQTGVVAIPKTSRPERVKENMVALEIQLSPDDLAVLDQHFPAPKEAVPLETI